VTILVTGGTGYVGGAVVQALLDRGEQVRVLARKNSRTDQLTQLGVEIARGDILDQSSIEAALDGCDLLYHAAAIYEFWVPDKQQLMRTEVEGTRNAMAVASRQGMRKVIYTSTSFTIGEARGQIGNETTQHRGYFSTAYEEAKYKAELEVQKFIQQGLPVVIVNPAGVYGPGGLKATGEAVVAALNGKLPMLFRGTVGFVYIDDVAKGHLLAAEKGRVGERYILCHSNLEMAEFIQRACHLAGVKPPPVGPLFVAKLVAHLGEFAARFTRRPPQLARDVVSLFAHSTRVDGSKAERELGLCYTPLEEGLPKTLAWYWEQGLLKQKPKFLE
jgi:dihydroflavonol-4-reductase